MCVLVCVRVCVLVCVRVCVTMTVMSGLSPVNTSASVASGGYRLLMMLDSDPLTHFCSAIGPWEGERGRWDNSDGEMKCV